MIEIKQLKGQKKYQEVTKLMNKHIQKMSENIKEEEIWFLEHQNVFTAGSSTPKEFKIDEINKIPVIKFNRGGKITFHGPGQLVIYPLINLKKRKKNIIDYINSLEDICIKAFKRSDIKLYRKKEKNRGLWVQNNNELKKIIFIGLRFSKGIIYHGLSINFNLDLDNFQKIDPCGLKSKDISSLKELKINYDKVKYIKILKKNLLEYFIRIYFKFIKFPI